MKLINTTVFRLSIRFSVFFALLTIGALLSVYYVTIHEIEIQTENQLFHELEEFEAHYNAYGFDSLVNKITERDHYGHFLRHYYTVLDENKGFVAGSQFLAQKKQEDTYDKHGIAHSNIAEYINDDGNKAIIRVGKKKLPDNIYIIAAVAQDSVTELRQHTLKALLYAVSISIVLALLVGTYMGRSVLLRIQRIDSGLDAAIKTDFTQHLALSGKEDEFQALTRKFNVTLDRVGELLQSIRNVTDNIAHDLRSPLTRMRSRLEVTLLKSRDEGEYRHAMEKNLEDTNHLLHTFNTLLAIAQAESGVSQEILEKIDLAQLTDELSEMYGAVAEEKGLHFNWQKTGAVYVTCRRQALAQAINNLLENAIKYTPPGGTISVNVGLVNNCPSIVIADTGRGIPEKDRKRVLERFQRLDNARNEPGTGLGLSLVNAIAKLCRAELILSDNNPGLIIELRFPSVQQDFQPYQNNHDPAK